MTKISQNDWPKNSLATSLHGQDENIVTSRYVYENQTFEQKNSLDSVSLHVVLNSTHWKSNCVFIV